MAVCLIFPHLTKLFAAVLCVRYRCLLQQKSKAQTILHKFRASHSFHFSAQHFGVSVFFSLFAHYCILASIYSVFSVSLTISFVVILLCYFKYSRVRL